MAAPTKNVLAVENATDEFCKIEATVATGFEPVAREEAEEKLEAETIQDRGKIVIKCPIEKVPQVLDLAGIDNVRVVMGHVPDFGFTDDLKDNLTRLRQFVGSLDWKMGLRVWGTIYFFEHPIADCPVEVIDDFGEPTFPPPRKAKDKLSKRSKKREKRLRKKGMTALNQAKESREKEEDEGQIGDKAVSKEVAETEPLSQTPGDEPVKTLTQSELTVETAISSDVNSKPLHVAAEYTENVSEILKTKNDAVDSTENKCSSEPAGKKPRTRETPWDPSKPAFRVTCNRNGDNHNFDSMSAAANFGGAIYRFFGWNVDMTKFNIEVILNIEDQDVTVCIGLTRHSLHYRNISHYGPTTLRPTIAHNMLRLCKIQPGDVVCDPMCGSGSIPIQSAVSWPTAHTIGGDIVTKYIDTTRDNLADISEQRQQDNKPALNVDVIRWNVCNLPLRDRSVDVFSVDLPFGFRMGSKFDNLRLYPQTLMEMARVLRPETGRVCLLTADKKCMVKTLQLTSKYWRRTTTLGVNIGGLAAGVYLLYRTTFPYHRDHNITFCDTKLDDAGRTELTDAV